MTAAMIATIGTVDGCLGWVGCLGAATSGSAFLGACFEVGSLAIGALAASTGAETGAGSTAGWLTGSGADALTEATVGLGTVG